VKLHRWEDALERGLLSIDDAAHRIKALRQERAALMKTKGTVELPISGQDPANPNAVGGELY
jgi:hypothetical protein